MNRDKAWLKEELLRDLMRFNGNPNMTDYESGIASGIMTAINLTEKLDEQELTQRQVDKWLDKRDMVAVDAMMVHQTGMQNKVVVEKPVIPQFVADWIEKWKREELILRDWSRFNLDDENEYEVAEWLYDNDDDEINILRKFTLIDAIRYGYEVDKEKKYIIQISEVDFMVQDSEGFLFPTDLNIHNFKSEFTEAEIKAIDKRFWAFAEEVKE